MHGYTQGSQVKVSPLWKNKSLQDKNFIAPLSYDVEKHSMEGCGHNSHFSSPTPLESNTS